MEKNWLAEIQATRQQEQSWRDKAKKCWEKYSASAEGTGNDVINVFNPNTDILVGALFNKMPKPDIRRRFAKKQEKDERKDKLYRTVATVADYSVQYSFDRFCLFNTLEKVFKDGFITGRGISKVVYDYETTQAMNFMTNEAVEEIAEQFMTIEHVHYLDFTQEVATTDEEITWKAQKLLLSKDEAKEEFGEEKAEQLDYEYTVMGSKGSSSKRTCVWEIWDKTKKEVVYISEYYMGGKEPLRVDEDPLRLEGFFPFDEFRTIDNGKNTLPTPEYYVYKDLNIELQKAARRVMRLTGTSIKYMPMVDNASQKEVSQSLNSSEGSVIGVNVNPTLGVLGSVAALPTTEAQQIAAYLNDRINTLINQIWEVTGVSDIMRGSTDARETALAQKQKGVFGTLRIQNRQKKVQLFIKSAFKKLSELTCEFMTIDNMQQITCVDLPTPEEKAQIQQRMQIMQNPALMQQALAQGIQVQPITQDDLETLMQPTWEEVASILRDDKMRSYTIDIETTATVFDDVVEERQQLQAMTQTIVNMLNQSATMLQMSPSTLDLMEELTIANLSNFKIGRSYIDSIKQVFVNVKRELQESAQAAQQEAQKPDPLVALETQRIAADNAIKQQKVAIDAQKVQNDSIKIANDIQYKNRDMAKDENYNQFDILDKTRQTNIKQQNADVNQAEVASKIGLETLKVFEDRQVDNAQSVVRIV